MTVGELFIAGWQYSDPLTKKILVGYGGTLPAQLVIPAGVEEIGAGAFAGRTFTSVEFPDSLTSIGAGVFSGCTSLTSVAFPDSLTSIGNYAFRFCYDLTSLTFSASLTSIGIAAFGNCTKLTSVEIPASVTSIGNYAFLTCSKLESVTFLGTPTTFGNNIFINCSVLATINVPYNWASPAPESFNGISVTRASPPQYTLTFDSQSGSAVASVTQAAGDVAKPADPTRAGYTFNGWFAAASGGSALTWPYNLTGYVKLYAQWSQNASAAGDPYVSTVSGKIYKLPAFNGALRLYQGKVNGKQLTVNATTRIDDDKQAMDADTALMNSRLQSPVARDLGMTEAMSFFDRIHVQLGESRAVFSVYDGFRQLSPLPAGWTLADKGTVANYLGGLPFYAHLAGSVHELSPCPGVTVRLGVVPIRHIRSTVEVAAPNMALGSGALVHRLARKQMAIRKLEDTKPLAAAKDAPVKRTLREAFVCDRATTHADIPFMG